MQLVIVIPAHNEEKNIAAVLKEAKKYAKNIIVVDDGSTDQTAAIAGKLGVKVLSHSVNLGKGAALKTGCDYACNLGTENIIVMDADGQHQPKEIPPLLKALKDCDIVFTCRKSSKAMPAVLKFGNVFINEILNLLYGIKIKDSQSGYRAFKTSVYPKIRWRATDYFMETEMIVKTGKNHLKYSQIPIETIYGDKYKGTTVIDGVKIVGKMFAWRLLR